MAAFWTSRVCAPWRRCIFQTKAGGRLFLRTDSGDADIVDFCIVRFGDGGPTFAKHPVMTRMRRKRSRMPEVHKGHRQAGDRYNATARRRLEASGMD